MEGGLRMPGCVGRIQSTFSFQEASASIGAEKWDSRAMPVGDVVVVAPKKA